ncbi:hypothetical protein [Streptomyces sp. NBC_00083]|uniref:hypothetical protein n=1 Tax=Streptomyces sp. NBC_00083 TaxID=2975647 RepID=UPI0022520332|nr:hypothetical protein [Streptomyces sp. NBC_00083]MCX5382640.1 hypothetical protein [Streptomyces sp. NBC_00083]
MTTPPRVPLPPFPPAPPAPPFQPVQPPVRRGRRAWIAVAVGVLIAALLAGATAWWLTRDDDTSPPAGRPRVTDTKAGLSYAIPEGWKHDENKHLIDAFTSSIARTGPDSHHGAVVLAGRGGPVDASSLRQRTETAARSNAEFFYPDSAQKLEESQPAQVHGRPAYTVVVSTSGTDGTTGRLRLTIITRTNGQSAFLLGVAMSPEPADVREVDAVLGSAAVE